MRPYPPFTLNFPFYAIYISLPSSLGEESYLTKNAIYFIPFDFRCHSCALPYQLQLNQLQTVIIWYSIGIFSDLFVHHIFIDFLCGETSSSMHLVKWINKRKKKNTWISMDGKQNQCLKAKKIIEMRDNIDVNTHSLYVI